MRRRQFIVLVSGAALAWPILAGAQQTSMPLIGLLSGQSSEISGPQVASFRQGLGEVGFDEGRNVTIESRWAENNENILPLLAADLVQHRVDLIAAIAFGSTPAALAAKTTTKTIPIVFAVGTDPIKIGLVDSLNRPGGNLSAQPVMQSRSIRRSGQPIWARALSNARL
jgi:putative ABC transport system substrate-binding protein